MNELMNEYCVGVASRGREVLEADGSIHTGRVQKSRPYNLLLKTHERFKLILYYFE